MFCSLYCVNTYTWPISKYHEPFNVYAILRYHDNLCKVNMPHWETIRRMMIRIRDIFHISIIGNLTVLNNRCSHLSLKHLLKRELSNPLIHKHLHFHPEDPQVFNVFASYQSAKWLEIPPHNLWVQMVSFCWKHFYIFEPVVLLRPNMPIMIPVFF
ncbi:hypothetical protein VP01_966g7 [Puccinia sorghi]|uniref:Uncharacterized protein n=1 Tax=Puccinia sorghi TaxID=27349 RepID=A0A0L6U865_9BASI|nr:hypothetical protein VP01_966g7 [Puccinia sorghi]